MAQRIQRDLFEKDREFGPDRTTKGDNRDLGKRKVARPFRRHQPIHIVMKSVHAAGKFSMLSARNKPEIDALLKRISERFNVKVHAWQNAGNHIHLIISTGLRKWFIAFLRTFAALVARTVTGSRRGSPQRKRFWTQDIFSRLIQGLRDLRGMFNYITKNRIEVNFGTAARKDVEHAEELARKERIRAQRLRITKIRS